MNISYALNMEYMIALIQAKQSLRGVNFDIQKAYDLVATLDDEILCVSQKIHNQVPKVVHKVGTPIKAPRKKDGTFVQRIKGHMGGSLLHIWDDPYGVTVGDELSTGAFCMVAIKPMNLNSSAKVKDYLLSQGWKPTQYNMANGQRTSPKLTEDSFKSLKGELPKLIARRNTLVHRRRLLLSETKPKTHGLIPQVRDDGRIEARAVPQATNTGRYRHSIVVNIPKASPDVLYGAEVRELFIPREGYVMLGCDAAALEARMEAHYCKPFTGGEAYAYELIEGDIHQKNADLFGTTRTEAKAPKYAMTYGAQPAKIAETLGVSFGRAKQLYDDFWNGNTALSEFRDAATEEFKSNKGWVQGLDGRRVYIRSSHAIVNALFQSAGSIIVKTATIYLDKWIARDRLKAYQVLHFHDEAQFEVHPNHIKEVQRLALKAFEQAGKLYNIRVPILGDVKIGDNWKETH